MTPGFVEADLHRLAPGFVEADLQVRLAAGFVEADLQVRLAGTRAAAAVCVPFKLSSRLKTFDYTGFHRYFLTICTRDRRPVFTDGCHVQPVLAQIRHTSEATRFAVIAYCFMPDHLHVLAEGIAETANFTQLVRIFKQRSSFEWKRATGVELWQRSYFERVLRADEDTVTVARYLLGNPARAGLVEAPDEYPFLGSLTMSVRELLESVQASGRRT